MKDSTTVLYPNQEVAGKVTEYSENRTSALPKEITDYHAWICNTQERANYCISTLQANSLVWFARMAGAKRVLEIGCYLGFSAAVWSHAVGPEGVVTGLEFSDEYSETARKKLAGLEIKNVEFITGPAIETLETLSPDEPYDLVFIDADKSAYPDYLAKLLKRSQPGATAGRLLKPGALIIADNVLRRGFVADAAAAGRAVQQPQRTDDLWKAELEALDRFNSEVANSRRIDNWLMPLFDGVMLGRLVD